jgi:hypothetical protein
MGMTDIAEAVCQQNKRAFENMSLSRRTIVRCVEEMNIDLLTQLNGTVQTGARVLLHSVC